MSNSANAVNHSSCGIGGNGFPSGHLGCCLPAGTPCPSGSTCGGANSCFTLGGSQGSCSGGTMNESVEIKESRKLRELFKTQFMNSSKSDKEAKIRKTIRRIIRNNKK